MSAESPVVPALPAWRPALLFLGLAVLYALCWRLLLPLSHVLWFLPAGLRLGCLWLLPTRRWGLIALGEWSNLALLAWADGRPLWSENFVGLEILPLLIYAGVVLAVRGTAAGPGIDTPRRMITLLGTGLLCAAMVSPVLSHFLPASAAIGTGTLAGAFAFLYGDFIGQLVLTPLILLLGLGGWRGRMNAALGLELLLQLLFSSLVFVLLRHRSDLAPYVLMLAFGPIFYVAFRQGWQGATLSVALTGLLIEGLARWGLLPVDVAVLQLALAVVGVGGLVLGAACSELRLSHERLRQRHRELGEMNQDLARAASDLRSISQRLVRLEEQGQRELAGELEYELGQAIHALGTRISLAFRDARDDQTLRLLESVREQVREMQDCLRRVLRQLRPRALDTQGLREAVAEGPLREMLEDAGILYETAFHGRVDALDEDAQTAAYRICQEAVRDASRLESVRRVTIRLEVAPASEETLQVEIQIDIEVSPFLEFPLDPHPLPAIADRVQAQNGLYRVVSLAPGVRHVVSFEDAGTRRF